MTPRERANRATGETEDGMNDVARDIIGPDIREAREATGKTLADMATRTGLTQAYLSDIERGRRVPPVKTMLTIMAALDYDSERVNAMVVVLISLRERITPVQLRRFVGMK